MPRYTLCPFYIDENKRSISCEDVVRRFDSYDQKWEWMDRYCDSEWEICPFAIALNQAYDKFEKGDKTALEKQKVEALERELKSQLKKLGRAEKKIQQLRDLNKSYLRRTAELESQKAAYYKRWRQESVRGLGETVMEQADKVLSMYRNVACYLLREHGGKVYEEDVEAWANGKVYTIYREFDEDGRMVWQVIEEEAKENEDGKDTDIQDDATAQEGK